MTDIEHLFDKVKRRRNRVLFVSERLQHHTRSDIYRIEANVFEKMKKNTTSAHQRAAKNTPHAPYIFALPIIVASDTVFRRKF